MSGNTVNEKKTPYQGSRRCFGMFKCPECEKVWTSGNSWANKGQECNECYINVYPHKQWRLKRKRSKKSTPAHPKDLCEKCKDIGEPCTGYITDPQRKSNRNQPR